jgi:predicted AlkP superfamily pyrophosphatase or phosphodiesterase
MREAGFADVPATVERLLTGAPGGLPGLPQRCDRVGVVLLDAFGRRFLERHADHPFLRRLAVSDLRTQFPSTTTAHVTTMHTGRPVGEHGLYEWNVYAPEIDAIVTPLLYSYAGDSEPDTLRGSGLDPGTLVDDGDTLYRRLAAAGAPSTVLQPAAFSPSTFDRVATAGARLRPFANLREGVEALFKTLREPGYAYLYWDAIDAAGHVHGPESREFDAAVLAALDALEHALRPIPGALLLVTADHGQVAVDPARIDYLDELWPGLAALLRHRPAGSGRDLFLHTVPGATADVVAALSDCLGSRGEVHATADLVAAGRFGAAGLRLRARLGDVCVLPGPGRTAWLRSAAGTQQAFRGHHGGLHPDEVQTWVGVLELG